MALHDVTDSDADGAVALLYRNLTDPTNIVAKPEVAVVGDTAIVISCATPGAVIYYTTDGTQPTAESPVYTDTIAIDRNIVVKTYAVEESLQDSPVTVANIEVFITAAPEITFVEGQLTIECDTEDATIRYVIGDEWNDSDAQTYTEPLTVEEPCVVWVVSQHDGYSDSDTVRFVVERCAAPTMAYKNSTLSIACATPDAVVRYTTDGTQPDALSAVYSEPLAAEDGMTVRAYAVKEGMLDSRVTDYTVVVKKVAAPELTFADGKLSIKPQTDGADTYYIIGAEWNSDNAQLYKEPVVIDEPCTVWAFSRMEGYDDSDVATLAIEQCAQPQIAYDGKQLTISCATQRAKMLYQIANLMDEEAEYNEAIDIAHNFTVTARAVLPGLIDSKTSTLVIDTFTVATPLLACDGPYVYVTCADDDAEVTVFANEAEVSAPDGKANFTIATERLMEAAYGTNAVGMLEISVVATKPYMNAGTSEKYILPAFSRWTGDGTLNAYVFVNGSMKFGTQWNTDGAVDRLAIHGDLNGDDVRYAVSLNPVFVDMSNTSVQSMPENAFASDKPLAAIKWNDHTKVSALGSSNPNLLFYCADKAVAPIDAANVIVNGKIDRVTLRDLTDDETAKTHGNFYCPEPFDVKRISYEHSYGMRSGKDMTEGWETLALPFDVQTVYHRTKQTEIVPFTVYEEHPSKTTKPFWLFALGESGMEWGTEIEAYKPYLISMPNNDKYVAAYNLVGNVSFRAENVTVGRTPEPTETLLIPAMRRVNKADNVYAINKYDAVDDQKAGSAFVAGLRDVQPFEAYMATESSRSRVISLIELSTASTGIADASAGNSGLTVYAKDGVLCLLSPDTRRVAIYSLSGQRVKTVNLHEGLNTVEGLPEGMYIVEHTTVFVH